MTSFLDFLVTEFFTIFFNFCNNISSIQLVFDIVMFCSSLSQKFCTELQILPFAKDREENFMGFGLTVKQIRHACSNTFSLAVKLFSKSKIILSECSTF